MSQQRRSRLDRFFGGQAGAANKALESMQRSYGRTDGQKVFDAAIAKRKRREKRNGRR